MAQVNFPFVEYNFTPTSRLFYIVDILNVITLSSNKK